MKKCLISLWAAVLIQTSPAQNGSFQIAIDSAQKGYRFDDIVVDEVDKSVGIFRSPGCWACEDFFLMPVGNVASIKAKHFAVHNGPVWEFDDLKAHYFHDRLVFGHALDLDNWIFSYDFKSGKAWCKGFGPTILGHPQSNIKSFATKPNGELLIVAGYALDGTWSKHDILHLLSVDTLGNTLWRKHLQYELPGIDPLGTNSVKLDLNPADGTAYMLTEPFVWKSPHAILKLDPNGAPLQWKTVEADAYEKLFFHNGSVFLLGHTKQPLPFSQNKENCILAKLDADLNPLWVRAYSGEAFEYKRSTLNFLPDGSMVLGYSTSGAFPTILAKLDGEGKIISQQGYPLYEPQLDVLSDGSLMMLATNHFDSTGKVFPQPIIARTGPDGLIDGCETFPACLTDGPASIAFGAFDLKEVLDTLQLIDRLVTIDSMDFNFSPFCDIPAPPAPDFFLPEKACLGDSLRTVASRNILADGREWVVWKNGQIVAAVRGPLNIGVRFSEVGSWKVSQKIAFLGCEYEMERTVKVLPPLDLKLAPESIICHAPPAVVSASAARPLSGFSWSTGDSTATVAALADGTFSLTATDGVCVEKDSVAVRFVATLLDGKPPLELPADTLLCESNLPYLLKPASLFSKTFGLGSPGMDSVFSLKKEGRYQVFVEIEGCPFSAFFELKADDCQPKIYFPTVFSPDGDGLNDEFAPLGEGFKPVKLTIFDRWGNIWHEGPGAWRPQRAQPGAFTFLFEFKNLLTGATEFRSGSVTVAR